MVQPMPVESDRVEVLKGCLIAANLRVHNLLATAYPTCTANRCRLQRYAFVATASCHEVRSQTGTAGTRCRR